MDKPVHLENNSNVGRLFAIDLLKAVSIVAVVSYHSIFVPEFSYAAVASQVEILFAPLRFCVPVLLTISFFLLARSLEQTSKQSTPFLLKKRLYRLIIPTLFWFTLAASLRFIGKVNSVSELLVLVRQGMVFPGAYYLLILLQLVIVFVVIDRWFYRFKNVLLTIGLQVLVFLLVTMALSGQLGEQLPETLRAIARPFVAYWFVYMALGAFLQKNWEAIVNLSAQIPSIGKMGLITLTSLFMIAEYSHIYSLTAGQPRPFEYAMSSCILSAVVYVLCFASAKQMHFPVSVQNAVQSLSKYSLGIFCINGITSLIFVKLGSSLTTLLTLPEILAIKLLSWGLLLAISLSLSVLLDRIGFSSYVR